ncbi:MAG: molybdopterin-dependent oxidoreductase [Acidimicrobiia bacterium]|nr:molybdopterin-dependent oxidoreductase [Acidimicrobiia bacterium]
MTGPSTHTVIGSCPLDCPDACSWVVTVTDGEAVRLRGNPDHPFTAGGLCKKVNPWLKHAADPTRLLRPHRRVAPKGPGVPFAEAFEPIGWDEAIDDMAARLTAIIDTTGTAAIWPFAGTGNVGFVQGCGVPVGSRLWNHLGVSGHHLTICSVSGHIGLGYSTGTGAGMDPEDVVDAGIVVIWGSNTLVANQHWWPFVERARGAGAPVVVIDPVTTRTALRADLHLAPRPGSDAALALGLCRQLIADDAVDHTFLADRTLGFDEFADSLDPWTIERTAEVCGLEPGQIVQLATLLADHRPLALKLGQGMQRHAGGGQAARVLSCVPALLGSFDHIGGGLVYSTDDPYRLNRVGASGRHLGDRPRHLAMTNLAANLLDVDDPPVEALIVHGANPVVSNPDTVRVREGLSRPDLYTVVIDIFATETVDYADLVLPSTMQHEQWELNNSFAHLYLNLNRPAVEPPGECLPHTEIFRRLARAMGLDEPALYVSDEELISELLDTEPYRTAGITLEVLKEKGWVRVPAAPSPYRPFADGFPTASRRFEFVSERAEADGHGRLPNHRPPVEAGPAGGSWSDRGSGCYDLIANGSDGHVNSVFAGTALVRERSGAPPVVLHSDDARRDGIADGDRIEVSNDRGRFMATAIVEPGTRPGVAATAKGAWSMDVNATVAERDSDMGRGAVYHDNRVTIRSLGRTEGRPSSAKS